MKSRSDKREEYSPFLSSLGSLEEPRQAETLEADSMAFFVNIKISEKTLIQIGIWYFTHKRALRYPNKSVISLWAKRVGEFIEISHKNFTHPYTEYP